jgi:MATE family multidrug resistance protein
MSQTNPNSELPSAPSEGSSYSQVLKLAWPLIISNSFTTIQISIDRYFLAKYDPDAVSAATSSLMLFWVPFVIMFCTASYVSTFVAQYTGAKRSDRVGPAIWQALYFSLFAGLVFMLLLPFSGNIISIANHSATLQAKETTYFQCLCWMAFPNLIIAGTSAFFSGRGDSRTVLWINGIGMIANAILDPIMIFGELGCPEMGILGAGVATVIATWLSAILGLLLVFQKKFRDEYNLMGGWRFERELFWRLMRFGVPSGLQWMFDTLAFTVFLLIAEWFSSECLAATSLAFTINSLIFIPMIGVGQAASILVGQRLGENDPGKAEKLTWISFKLAFIYMGTFALLFVLFPSLFITPFASEKDPEQWAKVSEILHVLLYFIAFYSLFDCVVLIFSFALKGAGDTVFVTKTSLILSWPVMVIPTYLAWKFGWSFYWSWAFASLYLACQGACFLYRFRIGKWKSMRVIEPAVT